MFVLSRGAERSQAVKLEIVDVEKVKGLSNYYVCEAAVCCSDSEHDADCVARPTSSGCCVRMALSTISTGATVSLMRSRIPWRNGSPSRQGQSM